MCVQELSMVIFVSTLTGMEKPKRKGGRPPKPAKDRASARVDFRCTAAEKASYRRKAGERGISAWLKKLADDA
jgi:hypothetical protein